MVMEEKTIEQKVADAILQEDFTVQIGPRKYPVQPISYGTLIRVSAIISTLPRLEEEETVFAGALRSGAHADKLARIAALCILNRKDTRPRYRRKWLVCRELTEPGVEQLTQDILYHCNIGEVGQILRKIFSRMELSDFFGVMVSLSGVNLIAETATTASGHLSEE